MDNPKLWAATNCNKQKPRGNVYSRIERFYLRRWRAVVHKTVCSYCDRHNLKRPNRCTTVQSAGTKSLLTNASPGWHPPKYATYIRRVGFNKNHRLGWLVEIPLQVPWANLPGVDEVDISKFSALAQFDFWLQVQQHYTTHNSSATIELTEGEIVPLGKRIYEAILCDEGYVSVALLPRLNCPFPRLPFELVSKETYHWLINDVKKRRASDDLHQLVERFHGHVNREHPIFVKISNLRFPIYFSLLAFFPTIAIQPLASCLKARLLRSSQRFAIFGFLLALRCTRCKTASKSFIMQNK